jgi:hypothetical protein
MIAAGDGSAWLPGGLGFTAALGRRWFNCGRRGPPSEWAICAEISKRGWATDTPHVSCEVVRRDLASDMRHNGARLAKLRQFRRRFLEAWKKVRRRMDWPAAHAVTGDSCSNFDKRAARTTLP